MTTRHPGRRGSTRSVLAGITLAATLSTAVPAVAASAQPVAPLPPRPTAASSLVVAAAGEAGAASGASAAPHYGFLSQQGNRSRTIARWNPCGSAIGYRVNSRGGGSRATADVIAAMARIRAATGLRLTYRGQTRLLPGYSKGAYPKDTQIVIAWTRPGVSRYLAKPRRGSLGAAGYGGGSWTTARDARGRAWGQFVRGFVVLNSSYRLAGGFGRGPATGWQGTRGQLLMHELGHVVGLDHTNDRRQIMYPTMSRKTAVYGVGDRTGLRVLGRASGCLYR